MSRWTAAAIICAVAFSVIVLLAWVLQRRLIYFPFGDVPAAGNAGLNAAPVEFQTADGLMLNGWFVRPDGPPWFTVIVFNGNAGNRAMRAPLANALRRRGL